jgi:unsaturated rhamnogalacturonyl hydrolase
MKRLLVVVGFGLASCAWGQGAGQSAAAVATEKMAASVMRAWPAGVVATTKKPGEWGYEEGVLLDGLGAEWQQTGNAKEFAYIRAAVDKYVKADGTIRMGPDGRAYPTDTHTLDDIEMGRAVLLVYRVTKEAKYATAAKFLHEQLEKQPRTASGAYWHKQIYPNQIWLDGAFMAEPFRAEYAATFQLPGEFDDIAKQFLLMDEHMRDPKTGLLRHGWDESKAMPWADRKSGLSPEVWARAMGWYCVGLVDVLDWFPTGHPLRGKLIEALKRNAQKVVRYQDAKTGVWWQVLDRAGEKGNFPEASASAMFTYALAKGVRKGYLTKPFGVAAERGWSGIQTLFVTREADGSVVLTGTVKVGGLGGTPYRSGKYDYYIGEKTGDNDAKGVGAYLLAGAEMGRGR